VVTVAVVFRVSEALQGYLTRRHPVVAAVVVETQAQGLSTAAQGEERIRLEASRLAVLAE
jgi:hypothetical protein